MEWEEECKVIVRMYVNGFSKQENEGGTWFCLWNWLNGCGLLLVDLIWASRQWTHHQRRDVRGRGSHFDL